MITKTKIVRSLIDGNFVSQILPVFDKHNMDMTFIKRNFSCQNDNKSLSKTRGSVCQCVKVKIKACSLRAARRCTNQLSVLKLKQR